MKGGLWLLFLASIGLRIGHYASPYRLDYVNDIEAHMIYIHYVRDHWAAPPVSDAFEFPQEPAYYWLAAPFYNPALDEAENQTGIARVGLVISLAGLGLLFGSLRYLSSWLARYGLLIFMGLTPAFVLRSDGVGTDCLAAFFGIFYFFCLQRLNRNPDKTGRFWWAVTGFMLELFTKLNGVVLVLSLPWLFWRSSRGGVFTKKTARRAGLAGALIVIWLGLFLHRAWVPEEKKFLLSKWAPFCAQVIDGDLFEYALHFDLPNLIAAGQTSIYGSKVPQYDAAVDKVRFSYPTWVFGNMLIGDWDYNVSPRLLGATRCVIIFGTIFPFGFILFTAVALLGRPITREAGFSPLNKTALALVVGMAGLSLYFTLTRPTVCCADYRLQAVTSAWAGWCFCRGLTVFPRGGALRMLAIVFLAGYTVSCLSLYYILHHTPNIPGTFW
ncbi:MAG: hypothetical protein LV481_11340 [Methylacidiphilales bacterium]|nr:hypothetical protein [Candidatus Methylacidiphilales bacterium]